MHVGGEPSLSFAVDDDVPYTGFSIKCSQSYERMPTQTQGSFRFWDTDDQARAVRSARAPGAGQHCNFVPMLQFFCQFLGLRAASLRCLQPLSAPTLLFISSSRQTCRLRRRVGLPWPVPHCAVSPSCRTIRATRRHRTWPTRPRDRFTRIAPTSSADLHSSQPSRRYLQLQARPSPRRSQVPSRSCLARGCPQVSALRAYRTHRMHFARRVATLHCREGSSNAIPACMLQYSTTHCSGTCCGRPLQAMYL